MKICVICKSNLDVSSFNKNKNKKDGLQVHCKECSKQRSKNHYLNNKAKYYSKSKERKKLIALYLIDKLKSGCVSCPEKDIVVLDFDHLSDKKFGISTMLKHGFSLSKIDEELSKCQILCANCHRRKTAKDFNWIKCQF